MIPARPVICIVSILCGCGGAPSVSSRSGAPHVPVCEDAVESMSGAPECAPDAWPISPCVAPIHPQLVGLWASVEPASELVVRFAYDGCYVTTAAPPPSPQTTVNELARRMYGHEESPVVRANALWIGDRLVSTSELGRFVVARRVERSDDEIELYYEREVEWERCADPRHAAGSPVPLARFQAECLNARARDLVCARAVVPLAAEDRVQAAADDECPARAE